MPRQYPYTLFNPEEPLPKVLVKRASKELGEVPGQVGAHLESFRRWLSSMPHLKCRTDDSLLLAFLRHAKFNHSKAQKRLDNFCTFRTSETLGVPSWFIYEQDRLECLMDFLRKKMLTVLGFTQEGVLCILMKVGGIAFITDLAGIKKRDLLKMDDPHETKMGTMYFQEAQPFRIKKLIYLNTPTICEVFYKAVSVWMKEKTKSKMLLLQNDLKPAYESVPGLEELMPSEYNGGNSSFDEICENTIKEFSTIPKNFLDFGISVDESKRPSTAKNLMRVYKDRPQDMMGTSGTYVKMEDEI